MNIYSWQVAPQLAEKLDVSLTTTYQLAKDEAGPLQLDVQSRSPRDGEELPGRYRKLFRVKPPYAGDGVAGDAAWIAHHLGVTKRDIIHVFTCKTFKKGGLVFEVRRFNTDYGSFYTLETLKQVMSIEELEDDEGEAAAKTRTYDKDPEDPMTSDSTMMSDDGMIVTDYMGLSDLSEAIHVSTTSISTASSEGTLACGFFRISSSEGDNGRKLYRAVQEVPFPDTSESDDPNTTEWLSTVDLADLIGVERSDLYRTNGTGTIEVDGTTYRIERRDVTPKERRTYKGKGQRIMYLWRATKLDSSNEEDQREEQSDDRQVEDDLLEVLWPAPLRAKDAPLRNHNDLHDLVSRQAKVAAIASVIVVVAFIISLVVFG